MVKSHKPSRHVDSEDAEQDVEISRPRRRRKMTLAQLEQRVKKHRVSSTSGKVTSMLRGVGVALTKLNSGTTQSARKMPSERDINKSLWG